MRRCAWMWAVGAFAFSGCDEAGLLAVEVDADVVVVGARDAGGDSTRPDSGGGEASPDAGATDAEGVTDGGPHDLGVSDSGAPDAGDSTTHRACPLAACTSVQGTAAVRFTCDEGASLVQTSETLPDVNYTHGLLAFGGGELLATAQDDLLRSTDYGCTWTRLAHLPTNRVKYLTAAGPHSAFMWFYAGQALYFIDGDVVTQRPDLPTPMRGVGVDPLDASRVRVVDEVGQLWTSTDGGETFSATHQPPFAGDSAYVAAFDPTNLDRVLIGQRGRAVVVTEDAGFSWQDALGFTSNAMTITRMVVSTATPAVVWAYGRDLERNSAPDRGRQIWRSTDGGARFAPVLAFSPSFAIPNNPVLAPAPHDADVLFMGWPVTPAGLRIFRYDASQDVVQSRSPGVGLEVGVIAFEPDDPTMIYLGVDRVIQTGTIGGG